MSFGVTREPRETRFSHGQFAVGLKIHRDDPRDCCRLTTLVAINC